MIKANIYRNGDGAICGFTVKNHGNSIVCAAVSAIVLNAVNSIDALTDEVVVLEHDEEGGFLSLTLPRVRDGKEAHDADLLLNSMLLGLNSIRDEYRSQIRIVDENGKH